MIYRLLLPLLLVLPSVYAEGLNTEAFIRHMQRDGESTATVLSIKRSPLSAKIRFTNRNPHKVSVSPKIQLLQSKVAHSWTNLINTSRERVTSNEFLAALDGKPPLMRTVGPGEAVEIELTTTEEPKQWNKGDVLRITLVHMQLREDFPTTPFIDRLRALTTKPHKSEQGVAPQSATRADSEPEGNDKPQPESEERSR